MTPETSQVSTLVAVGAVHVDDVAQPGGRLVSRASNPVSWVRSLGGVGANVARAAAECAVTGYSVEFIAAIGDDATGAALEACLVKCGVTPQLCRRPNQVTGRYTAVMDSDGELYIGLADVAVAEQLEWSDIAGKLQAEDIGLVLMDANLSTECLQAVAKYMSSMQAPLVAMAVSPSKALRLRSIASQIDLLFCNRREAAALIANDPHAAELHGARRPSLAQLGRDLQRLGFSQFVLSDGPAPVLVTSHTEKRQIQVTELNQQRSVNGAGDAMAGATLSAWITGMALSQAVREFGLPMAARVVSGARPARQI